MTAVESSLELEGSRPFRYVTIDVFTTEQFGGNQLAVFPEAGDLSSEEMQRITREFNYSESIFLSREGDSKWRARIFTPGHEVDFAGHPTVGASLVLRALEAAEGRSLDELVLEENKGPVPITFNETEGHVSARFQAPFVPQYGPSPSIPVAEVAKIVGLGEDTVDDRLPYATMDAGLRFTFLPVRTREQVAAAKLDLQVWERVLADSFGPQLYLFSVDGDEVKSRMFAPAAGIFEDPATGAAAAAFGSYIGTVRGEGKHQLTISQGTEVGRPSTIEVSIQAAEKQVEGVWVEGSGVIISEGIFHLR